MRGTIAIALVALLTLSLAEAQKRRQPRDGTPVERLGSHAISGRGCQACHPPHESGTVPLWEQEPVPAPSKTDVSGGKEKQVVPQPPDTANQPETVNERCLSCHDANQAKRP